MSKCTPATSVQPSAPTTKTITDSTGLLHTNHISIDQQSRLLRKLLERTARKWKPYLDGISREPKSRLALRSSEVLSARSTKIVSDSSLFEWGSFNYSLSIERDPQQNTRIQRAWLPYNETALDVVEHNIQTNQMMNTQQGIKTQERFSNYRQNVTQKLPYDIATSLPLGGKTSL